MQPVTSQSILNAIIAAHVEREEFRRLTGCDVDDDGRIMHAMRLRAENAR